MERCDWLTVIPDFPTLSFKRETAIMADKRKKAAPKKIEGAEMDKFPEKISLEKEKTEEEQDIIHIPESEVPTFCKKLRREAAMFERDATRAGLGGLTLYERVMGTLFCKSFRAMPDPIGEVIDDIDSLYNLTI